MLVLPNFNFALMQMFTGNELYSFLFVKVWNMDGKPNRLFHITSVMVSKDPSCLELPEALSFRERSSRVPAAMGRDP